MPGPIKTAVLARLSVWFSAALRPKQPDQQPLLPPVAVRLCQLPPRRQPPQTHGRPHAPLANAAGRGDRWLSARGWCAYTTRGNTRADALATSLYTAAQAHLPGHRLRTDYTDADPDLKKDFYHLRHTLAPAVLVENLFMDNPSDCAFLLSEEGRQALVDLHVDGICAYDSLF